MNDTLLSLAVAATLAAGGAFAQTSGSTIGADDTGTTGHGASPTNVGNDWSESLASAMFSDDGTELHSEREMASQWQSLSDEDKSMLRRDCMSQTQQPGSRGGTENIAADSTAAGTTGANTSSDDASATGLARTDGTSSGESNGMPQVSSEQMDEICDATKDL